MLIREANICTCYCHSWFCILWSWLFLAQHIGWSCPSCYQPLTCSIFDLDRALTLSLPSSSAHQSPAIHVQLFCAESVCSSKQPTWSGPEMILLKFDLTIVHIMFK